MTRAGTSLGLLPLGPDPVGEWCVHHQPPEVHISNPQEVCKFAQAISPTKSVLP